MFDAPSLWQVTQVVYVAVSLPILCNLALNAFRKLRLRRQLFNVYLQQTRKRASAKALRRQKAGSRGVNSDSSNAGLVSTTAAAIAMRIGGGVNGGGTAGGDNDASRPPSSSASGSSSTTNSDSESRPGGLALLEQLIRQYFGDDVAATEPRVADMLESDTSTTGEEEDE